MSRNSKLMRLERVESAVQGRVAQVDPVVHLHIMSAELSAAALLMGSGVRCPDADDLELLATSLATFEAGEWTGIMKGAIELTGAVSAPAQREKFAEALALIGSEVMEMASLKAADAGGRT